MARHDKHSNARRVVAMNAPLPIRRGHHSKRVAAPAYDVAPKCRSHHAPSVTMPLQNCWPLAVSTSYLRTNSSLPSVPMR